MSQKGGHRCLSLRTEKTCAYWAGALISYQTDGLKPDTSARTPCAHIVFVCFSLLYTSSLSASTMKSSCFSEPPALAVPLRCLASVVSVSPVMKSRCSPKVTAGSDPWHSQILYQRMQRAAWLLSCPGSQQFLWDCGRMCSSMDGWWMQGTIRLVSVMNLFHLIRCMEPSTGDTLQIASH